MMLILCRDIIFYHINFSLMKLLITCLAGQAGAPVALMLYCITQTPAALGAVNHKSVIDSLLRGINNHFQEV